VFEAVAVQKTLAEHEKIHEAEVSASEALHNELVTFRTNSSTGYAKNKKLRITRT
jgi:hypothetical protein